jgi:hypothetical protein
LDYYIEERSGVVAMCEQHNSVLMHYALQQVAVAIGRSGGHGNEL